MAETTTTGDLTGTEVTTGQDSGSWYENLPLGGGAVDLFKNTASAAEDGHLDPSEMNDLMSDGQSFIGSCSDMISGLIADPVHWLVSNGLDFLLSTFEPLQDALHQVSGDGPAMEQAAENFTNIGEGLEGVRKEFEENVDESLQEWKGYASETAGSRLAEFASGIGGVAGQAGDISQLLQASSKIMDTIEEFIKGLITDLVTFVIEVWVPALASAGFTFGASTAGAASATAARAGTTIARSTRQVSKLTKILEKLEQLLQKLSRLLGKAGKKAESLTKAGKDKYLKEGEQTLGQATKNAAKESAKKHGKDALTPDHDTVGDVRDQVNDAGSYLEAGDIGNDASVSTTSERLDTSTQSSTDGQWGEDPEENRPTAPLPEDTPFDDISLSGNDSESSDGGQQSSTTTTSETDGSTGQSSQSSSQHHTTHRRR